LIHALTVILTAASVFMLALGIRERLRPVAVSDDTDPGLSYGRRLARTWGAKLERWVPTNLRDDVGRNIARAGGLKGMSAAEVYLHAALSASVGLSIGLLVILATGWSWVWVVPAVLVCSVLPFLWLKDQVAKRHQKILVELPFHLDLLTLCVEAGLDFGAGVGKLVDQGRGGPLRDELRTFLAELRVGKTRAEALQSMSDRVGLDALTAFLSALIQADRLGAGLGGTLRAQADQMRSDRFQRAEKLANEAPIKMLLPLVLFIFPLIWIILAAPIVFDWIIRGGI